MQSDLAHLVVTSGQPGIRPVLNPAWGHRHDEVATGEDGKLEGPLARGRRGCGCDNFRQSSWLVALGATVGMQAVTMDRIGSTTSEINQEGRQVYPIYRSLADS